ncbi:MAG TPA: winged helix-turn-helix transcriptional regulator [Anaerolineales bacterium]|nr:winged helix-turn-helix transcriptional regulator [Anaerolineales bacterium]
MDTSPDPDREMILLEHIERDPDITQAGLAAQLGVAVGTVNWHLKRLVSKGYVKVKRAQRRKLRYIITPEGIAFRARLTVNYIDQSMRLYRRVRQRVRELLSEVKRAGFSSVAVVGEGDIADICKLTCLEQGVSVVDLPEVPVLEVHGVKVVLHLQEIPLQIDSSDGRQAAV